ncbi:Unknown protein sequence [Pseudomonas syringae pv. syringae]|uniref:Uncharacterized protein n=1 Tax=Pseudomonas syringae pv. aceris TaxID=199198 RepID=A0A0L8IIN0_PSESX|nr:Unknown protein sequence [Pseudomonas syringae pv. aceris]KPB16056.1 Unknown protein sequence [Pseudomonas syringae pv. syringae]KPW22456.1 hypothetical protein ALO91_101894 [Pseudomonas syringae pv. aceris]RMR58418.1 hypothetical protein ALP85_101469 [Pseudomonas syringae pv. syringae]
MIGAVENSKKVPLKSHISSLYRAIGHLQQCQTLWFVK